MSFLEPWLLLGLPAIALPVIIHLLNQRRHETVPWAASEFVKRVSRQNRGHAVLRQWLTLLLRMLAVAALIVVVSRPLATSVSGLSLLGTGRVQLVLVDRSPSMALRDATTGLNRREELLQRLDTLLETTNARPRRRLIEPHRKSLIDPGRHDLVTLPDTTVGSVTTDVPAMLETAFDRIETDALGPTDIWLCSDLQAADWKINSGRWARIGQRLNNLPSTKLRILSPSPSAGFNLAVSVKNVIRRQDGERSFLEIDLSIRQTLGELTARKVPVVVRVGDVERRIDADLAMGHFEAKGVVVELSHSQIRGGGHVEIPTDSNQADNRYFFSYAPPVPRRTVVVSDDTDTGALVKLVCETAQLSTAEYACDVLPTNRSSELNWSQTSMIVWHADLPTGSVAQQLEEFVQSGRTVLFLPPPEANPEPRLFDVGWQGWDVPREDDLAAADDGASSTANYEIQSWRRDADILATDDSGGVLPVGEIQCRRRCVVQSTSASALATFSDGAPLLLRAATQHGGAYFLTTLPTTDFSNFTEDGVVLFVMLHRCLHTGAVASSDAQQIVAGTLTDDTSLDWETVDSISAGVLPSERAFTAGLYSNGDKIIAINRSDDEDMPEVLDRAAIEQRLDESSFELVGAEPGQTTGLASELWKTFMVLVIIALLLEGWLSMPSKNAGLLARRSANRAGGGPQKTANPVANAMQETV